MRVNYSVLMLFTFYLTGCATQDIADPQRITLQEALVDTANALNAAYEAGEKNGRKFGFYGCTVTAVFNVSATAAQHNQLALSASSPSTPALPVSLGSSASFDSTATGARGNTVTVVLATKPCLEAASGKSNSTTSKTTAEGSNDKGSKLNYPREVFDLKMKLDRINKNLELISNRNNSSTTQTQKPIPNIEQPAADHENTKR